MTTGIFAAIGCGLCAIGAGIGIGKIGSSSVNRWRAAEAAGKIQVAMILSAALIEATALFGVVVSLMSLSA